MIDLELIHCFPRLDRVCTPVSAAECFPFWGVYLLYQLSQNVSSVASFVRPRGCALLVGSASQEGPGIGSNSRGRSRRCLNQEA